MDELEEDSFQWLLRYLLFDDDKVDENIHILMYQITRIKESGKERMVCLFYFHSFGLDYYLTCPENHM
jgi:hypothetical protein